MSGNSVANLLDGVVRKLEFVAIGIHHLGVLDLLGLGCERRQRRGRGRLTRAVEGCGRVRAGHRGVGGQVPLERNALGDCGGRHVYFCDAKTSICTTLANGSGSVEVEVEGEAID